MPFTHWNEYHHVSQRQFSIMKIRVPWKEPTCLTFQLCGFHTRWRIIKRARVTTNIQASVRKYGVGLRQLSVLYVNNVVILLRTDTSLRQAINVRHYYLLGMNLPRWSDLLRTEVRSFRAIRFNWPLCADNNELRSTVVVCDIFFTPAYEICDYSS